LAFKLHYEYVGIFFAGVLEGWARICEKPLTIFRRRIFYGYIHQGRGQNKSYRYKSVAGWKSMDIGRRL